MIRLLLMVIVKILLWFRYDIKLIGNKKIKSTKKTGMLFLPNHPAMIDPLIIITYLFGKYKARPMVAEDQFNDPFVRFLCKIVNPIPVPDLHLTGRDSADRIEKAMKNIINILKSGDNVVLYPSGKIYRSYLENIGGKSAVYDILKEIPDLEIVLIRTRGLWGSSFSKASGTTPAALKYWKKYLLSFFLNGFFFGPRRKVTVELNEDKNFPRDVDKLAMNSYMESFYNDDPLPNTYVPYTWFEKNKTMVMPEPVKQKISGDISNIPETTKAKVIDFFKELTGKSKVHYEDNLSRDLGLDSLASLEIMSWIEEEFGMPQSDLEALETVTDCILAAAGESIGRANEDIKPAEDSWFVEEPKKILEVFPGDNIAHVFLNQAKANPEMVIVADQKGGAKTNRDVILGIFVLKSVIEKLPGDNIGIMMPAAASSVVLYLATLFAGKTPVMLNWTVGKGNMEYSMNQVGVTHVITARALVDKLKLQGFHYEDVKTNWVLLEDVVKHISLFSKISAKLKSKLSWKSLEKAKIKDNAVILFTSGSEANPKSVPLTHKNIIANLKDIAEVMKIDSDFKLLGMLPPFHSLGLVGTILLPIATGFKTAYHANPTEAVTLAKLIENYKISLIIGTPTFINGILKANSGDQLKSVTLAMTGAEKCPDYVYDAFAKACPEATICEGYGITECSPVVSLNKREDSDPGTIGRVLPSIDYIIVNAETLEEVEKGNRGKLLVMGDSIFNGYLDEGVKSPFVTVNGKNYYDTGDLVIEKDNGILIFAGRVKRFIKLGGEMISLPAIEEALLKFVASADDEGPTIAVEATPNEDNPEIVVFTTKLLTREQLNGYIKEAGLSALHNIRRIEPIDEIPILGTGKTDYKKLKKSLK